MNYFSSVIAHGGCSCTLVRGVLVPMTGDQTHMPCVGREFFPWGFVCVAVLGLPCCAAGLSLPADSGVLLFCHLLFCSLAGASLEGSSCGAQGFAAMGYVASSLDQGQNSVQCIGRQILNP